MAEPIREDEPDKRKAREPRNIVGKPFRRVDGRAKVTGRTLFADDLSFPRMCYMRLVRSTVPHARIVSIDVSEASKVEGVLGFLTGAEMPEPFGILPVSQDEHALCPDKVRFVGDPVVAVAATTEDAAYEAAYRVRVEYEELTTIASVDEAIATPEPRIHDYGDFGNVHKAVSMRFGDVDAGFAAADLVLEDTVFYEGNTHLPMEQHSAVAVPEDDDRITLYSSTQTPHYVHRALTKVLEIPASRIRVVACSNGGGFGGKSDPFNHEIAVAKMALKLGRPVKVTLTREEVFYCHRGRHPVLMEIKTGFRKDGSLVAQHLKTALDGGAYGSYGVASTYYTGALQTVTYDLPAYHFQGVRAFTNKPPCGPKRGHGTPQPRFAFEIHLDKAAHAAGNRPRRPAAAQPRPARFRDGQLAAHRLDGARQVHRGGRRGERLARALRQAARRQRPRPGVRLLPLRRGAADLLEPHAAVRRAVADRPFGASRGLLRRGGDRPGLGFRARRRRRRGPGSRARRPPTLCRRHGPHARRSGQLLVPRHPDGGQRGPAGGGPGARRDRRRGGRAARGAPRPTRLRRAQGLRRQRSGPRHGVARGLHRRGGPPRHPRIRRLLHAAPLARQVPRRRRRSLARLLLQRLRHRDRGRPRDGTLRAASTSGWRTTSGAPSTRCSSSASSREGSTWASARR